MESASYVNPLASGSNYTTLESQKESQKQQLKTLEVGSRQDIQMDKNFGQSTFRKEYKGTFESGDGNHTGNTFRLTSGKFIGALSRL